MSALQYLHCVLYFCILCTIFILHAAKNCDLSVGTHHVCGVALQERAPPCVDDFLYICDDAYKRSQLITMEIGILQALNFDINIPVPYRFLRRYAKVRDNTYIFPLWKDVCVCLSKSERQIMQVSIHWMCFDNDTPPPPYSRKNLCVCDRLSLVVLLLVVVRSIPIFNSCINWALVKAPWFNNVFICFYLSAEWLVLLIALTNTKVISLFTAH